MKQTLVMCLSLVLVAAIAIGGTVAYLTTEPAKKGNVFTVGNIDIELDEETGVIGEGGEVTETEDGAKYDGVMPGDYLQKEVTVTNTGKNPAYVAVTVTMNNAAAINAAIDDVYGDGAEGGQAMYDFIFDGWGINQDPRIKAGYSYDDARGIIDQYPDENVLKVDFTKTITDYWLYGATNWFLGVDESANKYWIDSVSVDNFGGGYYAKDMAQNEICYTYYLLLDAGESSTLFNGLNVPAEFSAEQLKMFDGLEINIEAAAIQADNIPGTGDEKAKNAFTILAGYTPDMKVLETFKGGALEGQLTDSALDVEKVILPVRGTVTWTTGATHLSTPLVPAENTTVNELIIDGGYSDISTFKALGKGIGPVRAANGATLVLRNLTIVDESESYAEGSWEHGYLEMAGKLRFENCIFEGAISLIENSDAEFINCTFNSNKESEYDVWVGDGSASFYACKFEGYRGLKIHADYKSQADSSVNTVDTVLVDNCTFGPLSKKPGIAIGTGVTADTVLTVTNSSFINCQPGDQNLYMYESDVDVTTFKFTESNNTVGNTVSTANELKEVLSNGGNAVLTEDVKTDAPIIVSGGTLDGGGNTIDASATDTSNWGSYAVTLGNGSTVQNVTVTNAGKAIGSTSATEDVYIDNVTTDYVTYAINGNGIGTNSVYVTNSNINGWCSYSNVKLFSFENCKLAKGNSYDGYLVVYGDTTFTDCTFDSFTMGARYQDGAVVATGKTVSFTNCSYVTAEGTVKVTADNFKTLFMAEGDEADFNNLSECKVVIDGVTVFWD